MIETLQKISFGDFLILKSKMETIAEYFFAYIIEQRDKEDPSASCGSTLNAQKFVLAQEDPDFKKALQGMDHLRADGMPIVWFSRLFGSSVEGKSSTTDFIHILSAFSSKEKPLKYFFLGADEETVHAAKAAVEKKYDVEVVGVQNGFFNHVQNDEIIERINALRPDVLWVGMGVPKEQNWVRANKHKLMIPLVLTCGGLLDFLAEKKRRAPLWMQQCGLEWVFRLIQEPRRLWRRYLIGNLLFLWLVAGAFFQTSCFKKKQNLPISF